MAIFESIGTISYMSEIASGTSKRGNQWQRMSIVLDIPGYQGTISKLLLNVDANHIDDILKFKLGDKVKAGWTVYAREWKDKWYNSVDLVNVAALEPAQAPAPSVPKGDDLEPKADDLPF